MATHRKRISWPDMLDALSGATRIHFIVGDPIAQVKSPWGMTQAFEAQGRNAVCIPAHVRPQALTQWFEGVSTMHNLDGLIVTVPHKFSAYALCASATERAQFVQAANTLRRRSDGRWHGDMCDGLGYVQALIEQGADPRGKSVLVVGSGGAGSAIAHAVVVAGARHVHIHDADVRRRDALIARLQSLAPDRVSAGKPQALGHDILINATPTGMQAHDPLPLDLTGLRPQQTVGCVITSPAVTPLIARAREQGCPTVTGADMFGKVREAMVAFLLETAA